MTPEELAELFHTVYERLAPNYGYVTRKETAVLWTEIPADNANKRLMIAVASEVLARVLLSVYDSETMLKALVKDFVALTSWDASEMIDCGMEMKDDEFSAEWVKDRDELHRRAQLWEREV